MQLHKTIAQVLARFVTIIDSFNEYLGRAVAWLTLGTVLTCFAVVFMRYFFGYGLNWLREAFVWQHAIVFMMGAGYALMHGSHVKVDIFFNEFSARRQAWVNILGTLLFLFPWLIVLAVQSQSFILNSWRIGEGSGDPGGIAFLYIIKTVLWGFCLVLGLQGLSLMARNILVLMGVQQPVDRAQTHEPDLHQ